MSPMTARSLRGASPSKVGQLFPDLLPEALRLGRWTNRKTFNMHYRGPVRLQSSETPPAHIKGNVQQVLRFGFQPTPPPLVSAADYMKGPSFWVGKTIPRLGKISEFDEGIYTIEAPGVFNPVRGSPKTFYHYELMSAVSKARTRS